MCWTAPALWLVATLWLPRATGAQTGNRLDLIDQLLPTGLRSSAELHPIDKGFYVLKGEIRFMAAGQAQMACLRLRAPAAYDSAHPRN